MEKIIGRGLSFEDVLLIQQVSDIESRYDPRMSLKTKIANGVSEIQVPFVSANMDTVTEHEMAIAMARYGGLGVIHRFITPEEQVKQVKIVKAEMAIIENDPLRINSGASVADARRIMENKQRGYIIVVPPDGKPGEFMGMVSKRDILSDVQFTDPNTVPVTAIMTPFEKLHTVPKGTTLEQAVYFMKVNRIEKVPVINPDGTLVGVYTIKDEEMLNRFPNASKDAQGRLMVAAAIGVKPSDIDRAKQLQDAGVDVLVLDVAHGAMRRVGQMINILKGHEGIIISIIAGNISTGDTAKFLAESGADGIKVGVGPGMVCDTRIVAGTGYPQLSAIMQAREAMDKQQTPIPVMADGGIRQAGDIPKAIGAGADSVMIGSLFAGTTESPGEVIPKDGKQQKMVRGMASSEAHQLRQQIEGNLSEQKRAPEGNTKFVSIQGDVKDLLFKLEGGLRSGMSYSNALNINEMKHNAQFVEVSVAGANEQNRPLK